MKSHFIQRLFSCWTIWIHTVNDPPEISAIKKAAERQMTIDKRFVLDSRGAILAEGKEDRAD